VVLKEKNDERGGYELKIEDDFKNVLTKDNPKKAFSCFITSAKPRSRISEEEFTDRKTGEKSPWNLEEVSNKNSGRKNEELLDQSNQKEKDTEFREEVACCKLMIQKNETKRFEPKHRKKVGDIFNGALTDNSLKRTSGCLLTSARLRSKEFNGGPRKNLERNWSQQEDAKNLEEKETMKNSAVEINLLDKRKALRNVKIHIDKNIGQAILELNQES
jgi:hypothetical protein